VPQRTEADVVPSRHRAEAKNFVSLATAHEILRPESIPSSHSEQALSRGEGASE